MLVRKGPERVGDEGKAVGIPSPGGFAVYYLITRAWRDLPRRSSGSLAMFASNAPSFVARKANRFGHRLGLASLSKRNIRSKDCPRGSGKTRYSLMRQFPPSLFFPAIVRSSSPMSNLA